jgi:hypothetical protein
MMKRRKERRMGRSHLVISIAMTKLIYAAFVLAASFPTQVVAQADIAVPPGERVADTAQADWSKAWWQWAGSFDRASSPVADRTGANCHLKQNGPVWFLAGTYGTQRSIRTCKVPRDKYLFFPLINYVVMPTTQAASCGTTCCPSFTQSASSVTDQPSDLLLELDGRRIDDLERYRQATTECFDMGALAEPKYRIFPSAANGYYVMLRPLSPGKHVLNFGGRLPGMSQAVTYTLFVE